MLILMNVAPAAIAAQMAIVQKDAAMSMLKAAAQAEQAIVEMVAAAADRGANVNISV